MNKSANEQRVLGCFLNHDKLDGETIAKALLEIDTSCFDTTEHKQIFKYLQDCYFKNKPIDTIDCPYSNFAYLSSLQDCACHDNNLIAYCQDLVNQRDTNNIKSIIHSASNDLKESDSREGVKLILDNLRHQLTKQSSEGMNLTSSIGMSKSIHERLDGTDRIERMPTGDSELDKILGGGILKPSINILGGQSGTGKTTFAAKLLNHLSIEQKYKSAFFSLEMPVSEISIMTICHSKKISRSQVNKQEPGFFDDALSKLEENNGIIISANKSLSIEDIFMQARYIKANQGLDVVFIDFLTALRVKVKTNSEYDKINCIMSELGRIADDLNVAVIMLAQVNRDLSNSKDGKPSMNHLKGSSSIENFADYILFAHKESVANPDCGHDYLELLIRKNRYGKNGSVFYKSVEGTIFETNQAIAKSEEGAGVDFKRFSPPTFHKC